MNPDEASLVGSDDSDEYQTPSEMPTSDEAKLVGVPAASVGTQAWAWLEIFETNRLALIAGNLLPIADCRLPIF